MVGVHPEQKGFPMSQPPELPPLLGQSGSDLERTAQQEAHEAVMGEVSATLANIEQAIYRADKARKAISRSRGDHNNVLLALGSAIQQLEATRKELFQRTYFDGPQQQLF